MYTRHNIFLFLTIICCNISAQKQTEHNLKIGCDFNFFVFGKYADEAVNNPFNRLKDPVLRSANLGFIYNEIYPAKNMRVELGVQLSTYGSQFIWVFPDRHGLGPPEEALVSHRYTVINFPLLIGYQKNKLYACGGLGLTVPFFYTDTPPYGATSDYFLLVPSGTIMMNAGHQFVFLKHKFSAEFQTSLFYYSFSIHLKSSYSGFLNAGIALKYNVVKSKETPGKIQQNPL
jgi:hypothetical protein